MKLTHACKRNSWPMSGLFPIFPVSTMEMQYSGPIKVSQGAKSILSRVVCLTYIIKSQTFSHNPCHMLVGRRGVLFPFTTIEAYRHLKLFLRDTCISSSHFLIPCILTRVFFQQLRKHVTPSTNYFARSSPEVFSQIPITPTPPLSRESSSWPLIPVPSLTM